MFVMGSFMGNPSWLSLGNEKVLPSYMGIFVFKTIIWIPDPY